MHTHLLEEALQPQGPVEATLNLLQPLLKDIQNLLGGSVILQGQGLPCLGQALLEKGGYAQTWPSFPPSLPFLPNVSTHLPLSHFSPEPQH